MFEDPPNCWLHRQASFYAANWPEGTDVSEGGDAYAFYLPPIGEEFGNPVLGGGEVCGHERNLAEPDHRCLLVRWR